MCPIKFTGNRSMYTKDASSSTNAAGSNSVSFDEMTSSMVAKNEEAFGGL